ncbi:MAG: MBOAT family protein [Gammaproteobacteria bacterium]|nr:MAG: MBOAT family protein [Gammaproteobacteria bacterium]
MLFNSFEYLVFYAVFFLVFFAVGNLRAQVLLIGAASLYFYGSWSAAHVLLLLLVCTIAWSAQHSSLQRFAPVFQVAALLSILFVFKYFNFFVQSAEQLGLVVAVSTLVLPVGISFYVFQAVSYVIDEKRQHIPRVSFSETLAYIAFFPQLVAGPIVRAHVFLPQLQKKRVFNKYMFYTGILLFAMGMFKKVVIADNVGLFVDIVYETPGATSAGNHVLAFYLYAIQIYYDFCGYSEMAIGIARTLGFKFPRNFARPYLAASITEFWHRWHISLSSWLRDYLYIPLGGNRRGRVRTYMNIAIVMLLGGLWHGAAWTFVVWGGLHGALLAAERLVKYRPVTGVARFAGIIVTFHLVAISWVFFRSPDFASAGLFFQGMFDVSSLAIITSKFVAIKSLLLVVLFVIIERFSMHRTFLSLRSRTTLLTGLVIYGFLFFLLGNFEESPFIYFQF